MEQTDTKGRGLFVVVKAAEGYEAETVVERDWVVCLSVTPLQSIQW